jgi:small-conductance mechanosensitive channel
MALAFAPRLLGAAVLVLAFAIGWANSGGAQVPGPGNAAVADRSAAPSGPLPLDPTAAVEPPAPDAATSAELAADRAETARVEAQGLGATALLVHARLREVIVNAAEIFADFQTVVRGADPRIPDMWLLLALSKSAAMLAIGFVAATLLGHRLRRVWLSASPPVPPSQIAHLCHVATKGMIGVLCAVVLMLLGVVVNDIVNRHYPAQNATVLVAVLTVGAAGIVLSVLRPLVAPDEPAYRVIRLTDPAARSLWRDLRTAIVVAAVALGLAAWVRQLPVGLDAFRLVYLAEVFVAMIAFAAVVLRQRAAVAGAILAAGRVPPPAWRRLLGSVWHLVTLAYLLAAWLVSSVRVLLDETGGVGLIAGLVGIIVLAFGLYGLAVVAIEAAFRTPAPPHAAEAGTHIPTYKDLVEKMAAIVVAIVATGLLFRIWGVDVLAFDEASLGTRFFDEVLIALLAYLAYQATRIAIDRRLMAEGDHREPHGPGAEEGGDAGGASTRSRLATLLHLFRGFALVTIVVMAIMIGLSEMGINIAPLFAGASVVGLAIGFGAQTLIRDIFSGAFFLIDDAFRRGEYIDIGFAKGTVEKISIRSLQLRHQNGPLDTVPFGVIRNVRNFSRDWVIMKLPLRLTWDTDVERVRKIVKAIGQELAADPVHGPKFLDPLKSQGVIETDDSAMIVRVKFMTRPGDQFILRRLVYARIKGAFAEAGIRFASREVVVRLAGDGAVPPDAVRPALGAVATTLVRSSD